MGRASLLGMCINSLHKTDVWAYAMGLHSGPVHILISTPSITKVVSFPKRKRIEKNLLRI